MLPYLFVDKLFQAFIVDQQVGRVLRLKILNINVRFNLFSRPAQEFMNMVTWLTVDKLFNLSLLTNRLDSARVRDDQYHNYFLYLAINLWSYPYASIKDAQATGEAFSPQKRTSSTSNHENFYFLGPFLPSWIRIQQLKLMWIHFHTRWDSAREWDDQYHNYQKIMDYVNSHPELGVDIQWGTLRQGGLHTFQFYSVLSLYCTRTNFYFYQQR